MADTQDPIEKTINVVKKSTSTSLKIFSIFILVLLLLIPSAMIQSLIFERQQRRDSVVREISQKWGNSQTITGPYLSVPYLSFVKDSSGKRQAVFNTLHILPEKLNVTGNIKPEVRYRSLYEAVLYNSKLKIDGNFKIPSLSQLNIDEKNMRWNKVYLSVGITDMRGIKDKIDINFDGSNYNANPGLKTTDLAASGVSTAIRPLSVNKSYKFSFDLNLNGSERINFIPVGESNIVNLRSSWPSPSFDGAFLPITRNVNKDGFSAKWKILHLNRNYPQFWEGSKYKVEPSAFGLQLILTADIYQKSTRVAKYALMFIVFTFSAFFFSEIINRRRVHPIQYVLIGLAILLFYTLLLSISEYINFNFAYLISAAAITLIISAYSKAIIHSKFAITILGILTILYSYLFIVLQLEDYALIMGSIGLLIILGVVMYITRKIDWYAVDMER